MNIRIIKIADCGKLTAPNTSTLTYNIGVDSTYKVHFRTTDNNTGGLFSPEWIALNTILETIKKAAGDKQFSALIFDRLFSYGLPSDTLVMSEEEKVRTAYHETGHLIAYKLLFPELRVEFITIIPREQALGFVATARPDEYNSNTRDTISRYLQVMLAGRVAEKIYHGSSDLVSTGASSDIEKATHMAMNAIYEGGLSADIGPVNLNMLTKFEESNLLHVAQENVRQWIEQSERNVEKLIIDNNELFHFFAQKLIQKESMHADEIDDTIKSFEA